jgi:hypothetical protein
MPAADAALASDNDNPAAPNAGKALSLRFGFVGACFACNISASYPSYEIRLIDCLVM